MYLATNLAVRSTHTQCTEAIYLVTSVPQTHKIPATMVQFLYIVVYHEKGRKPVPAHWATLFTEDEGKYVGPVYQAIGNPFQGYNFKSRSLTTWG